MDTEPETGKYMFRINHHVLMPQAWVTAPYKNKLATGNLNISHNLPY